MCSPFLLYSTAPPSTTIEVTICILPKELTSEWDKKPLGYQIVMTIAGLLKSENAWQCKTLLYYPLDIY